VALGDQGQLAIGPIGIKSYSVYQKGNMEGRLVIVQKTKRNIIPPICFHLNRVRMGKDDSFATVSSEKLKKNYYTFLFRPKSINFVKIFELYRMTLCPLKQKKLVIIPHLINTR
jgi:hypothetical protein